MSATNPSPSSRRAWIEIVMGIISITSVNVALLAEGVDRNRGEEGRMIDVSSRPPRGGRG